METEISAPEFVGFQKIARLFREMVITEKIDGTNAQIFIAEDSAPITYKSGRIFPFLCASRKHWIQPENDNHGFAKWAYENATELLKLGPGHHFGEWWGQGIQRGYGLKEKRFSLFNLKRWSDASIRPACCHVVPMLYEGEFNLVMVQLVMLKLQETGSMAAPDFMKPEGVVIYHTTGNVLFKATIENDDEPKGKHNGDRKQSSEDCSQV